VPGPIPRSPLAEPPRATDWGKTLTGIECRRTEDGKHIGCTTPGGRRFNDVPAEGFPAYIGTGEPTYHSYDVVVPGRRRSARSGIERDPTPGPYWSVAPATAEGTPNSAVPPYVQFLQYLANLIPAVERRIGSASWPVASHAVVDQYGRPAVMNVINPDHPGFPGVVVRAEERLPSGNHRLRKQGAGLSALQSPNLPGILRPFMNARDAYTDYLWRDQSQDVIDRVRMNPRYGQPLE
jgi:hypothetical protein